VPNECLFCRIVAGDVPAGVVAANERAIAIQDINPQAPTHLLVIPREHYADVGELVAGDRALAAELLDLARQVAVDAGVGQGWRLVFNTGAESGQTVFHVHGHVLGGRPMHWPPG
jgi:histidine triad (HIT) family protein